MPKRAFLLFTGADTGGTAIRSVEAFRDQKLLVSSPANNWEVRAMMGGDNYIRYRQDLPYNQIRLEIEYDRADVVHLSHIPIGHEFYDGGQGKPTVLMHHGLHEGSFAINFPEAIAQGIELGCVQIGSTANLEFYGPPGTITWTPTPYDLDFLAKLRLSLFKPSKTTRICHAPTDRAIKSTESVIEAVKTLKDKGLNVELVLIEGKTNEETLKIKAERADIFIDQLILGYGCNAIEAWGMGIPVVGGVSYPGWHDRMIERWGSMPLYEATESDLATRLERLVRSKDLQETYAGLGKLHAERWHSQVHHVHQMAGIYEAASLRPTKPSTDLGRRRLMPGHKEISRLEQRQMRLARLAAKGRL